MAIVKSPWIIGTRMTKRPQTTGAIHVTQFTYDFGLVQSQALAAGDILELAILPSGAKLVDATLITEGAWAALTAEVGLMTGEVGADTNADGSARTSDSSLFAAAVLATTFARLAKPDVVLLARPENTETSVGVKVSGAVAKAAGKRIHLILYYYQ